MITDNQNKKATGQGFSQTATFKIAANADAFKILSDSLYSNKVAAPIRELSTNAYDAHVSNGNTNEPFLVHLPNSFEPHFSVRDYGIGLSQESIYEIYTTYFESTRNKSDQFVGGFGLGSKSPFCRVDAFTVVSYFNGEKSTYSMYLSEGLPTVSLIHSEPTTERNGLEVSFPVDAKDFQLFALEARKIYSWFDVKPTVVGNVIQIPDNTESSISGKNWYCSKAIAAMYNYNTEMHVRVGNVAYLVSSADFKFDLNNLKGFVLEVPIGSVSITPSRERLQFDEKTIKTLNDCMADIKSEFSNKVQQDLDKCASFYDAKVKELDFINEYGRLLNRSQLTYKGESLNVDNIQLDSTMHLTQMSFVRNSYSSTRLKLAKEYTIKALPFLKNVKFVLEDIPTGTKSVVNFNYAGDKVNSVFIIPNTVKLKEAVKALKINKSDIILASSLPKKPKAVRGPRVAKVINIDDSIETFNQFIVTTKYFSRPRWQNLTIPKNEDKYYYVELNNHTLIGLDDNKLDHIVKYLIEYKKITIDRVYGVRRGAKDAVANSKKWVNLATLLPEILALVDSKEAIQYYIRHLAEHRNSYGSIRINHYAKQLIELIYTAKNDAFNKLPTIDTLIALGVTDDKVLPSLQIKGWNAHDVFASQYKKEIDDYINNINKAYSEVMIKYPILGLFADLSYNSSCWSSKLFDLILNQK